MPSAASLVDKAKSAATDQATSVVGTDLVDSATSVRDAAVSGDTSGIVTGAVNTAGNTATLAGNDGVGANLKNSSADIGSAAGNLGTGDYSNTVASATTGLNSAVGNESTVTVPG